MQVYVGEYPGAVFRYRLRALDYGIMAVTGLPTFGFRFAFDNCAFRWAKKGQPFDEDLYLKRLDRLRIKGHTPDFAVIPDIPQLENVSRDGGLESLEFSFGWMPRLPDDWNWYLAVQDGMEPEDLKPLYGQIDGIFLGGSDEFKTEAKRWQETAQEMDIPFHYGRCGTLRKLNHAFNVQADSCDSALMLWSEQKFTSFCRVWRERMSARDDQCSFGFGGN